MPDAPYLIHATPLQRSADMDTYDMIVIGSGPAGQKAAIAAAKLGRRAAIVERWDMVGGVCINTGTIPSKTLREAVLYLTGLNQRELYGQSYRVKDDITVTDLSARTQHVVAREIDVIRNQLARNHVTLVVGTAQFVDPHTLVVVNDAGNHVEIAAEKIVVAVGTKPARPDDGGLRRRDDRRFGPDPGPGQGSVLDGGGRRGRDRHRVRVDVRRRSAPRSRWSSSRSSMLDFCDKEIVEALQYQLRELAVTFRFSETVREVQKHPAGTLTILESGKKIPADTVLYSAGRQGVTDELNIAAAGVAASNRGRVEVNEHFQTEVDHIYAVGDVIGFPALAATAMEQGRRATYHAFGEPVGNKLGDLQPIGIYTIPEISFVGRTEEELTKENVPFEVGHLPLP